jgi:predicted  nucleic acid-binding Zn-ribbon protein
MSDDVFTPTEGDDSQDNPLSQLVGEGKKFSTAEELARGKLEADKHISQLENEMKMIREQMAELESKKVKETTVSDLMETIKKANAKAESEGNQPISEEDLRKTVQDIMEGRLEEQTRAENRARANKAVLDKVGGDVEAAKAYVAERAKELNMSVESLQTLSEDSPSAFLKLIGQEAQPGSPGVSGIHGAANTASMDGTARQEVIDGHHTKVYYDKLKAELGPRKYWLDPKIQAQYSKDAMALGERFNQ